MKGKLALPTRIVAALLVPLALILLLPILLVFVAVYYVFVWVQTLRSILDVLLGRVTPAETAMQKPHFLDAPVSAPARSVEERFPASPDARERR